MTLLRNRPRSKQQTESEKAYEELEAAYSYKKSPALPPFLYSDAYNSVQSFPPEDIALERGFLPVSVCIIVCYSLNKGRTRRPELCSGDFLGPIDCQSEVSGILAAAPDTGHA